MSKDTTEKQLDLIIYLLENLPRKMCDEMDVRAEVKRHQERERMLEEREALLLAREECANKKMDNHNGRVQSLEKNHQRKEV